MTDVERVFAAEVLAVLVVRYAPVAGVRRALCVISALRVLLVFGVLRLSCGIIGPRAIVRSLGRLSLWMLVVSGGLRVRRFGGLVLRIVLFLCEGWSGNSEKQKQGPGSDQHGVLHEFFLPFV
jgi:hypothetical protein